MKNLKPSDTQIKDVIETYYKFPEKGITVEMLKSAKISSGLDLSVCKNILNEHIKKLSK